MTPPIQCRECRRTYRHAETCSRRRLLGRHSIAEADTVAPDAHLDEHVSYAETVPEEVYESFDHPYAEATKADAYEAKVETAVPEPPPACDPPQSYYDSGSSYGGGDW